MSEGLKIKKKKSVAMSVLKNTVAQLTVAKKKYSCKITIYSCEKKITVVKFVITVVNLR